eukprot:1112556-Pyramimonas_sp.AAC.1
MSLGSFWGSLLGRIGGKLAVQWPLGAHRVPRGALWGLGGSPGGLLGASRGLLGASWGPLDALLGAQ